MKKFSIAVSVLVLACLMLSSCDNNEEKSQVITSVVTSGTVEKTADETVADRNEDYADRLFFESSTDVQLLVFCCGRTYMTIEVGNADAGWVELYGNLPDKGRIKDGGFGLVTADITRVSGGVSGYMGSPRIDRLKSAEAVGIREAGRYCNIRSYSRDVNIYNEPLICGEYMVIDLHGVYYVYRDGKAVGQYDDRLSAEAAMGLTETDPDSHMKELNGIGIYLIRCGDTLLTFSHHSDMNRSWTPLLNPGFDTGMLGYRLEDGEAVKLDRVDVVLMNGGDAGYVNAPLIMSFGEATPISGDSLTYFVIQPGELETISADDNARFVLTQGGSYIIFLIGGEYRVYLCMSGEKAEYAGSYETLDEAAYAVGAGG